MRQRKRLILISIQAKMIFSILRWIRFKDRIDFVHPARSKRAKLPHLSKNKFFSIQSRLNDRNIVLLAPKFDRSNWHIMFLHGGAYSMEASQGHFNLIQKLIDTTKASITYVDYPLAPEATVDSTCAMVMKTYETLLQSLPNRQFVLMGDSAGGGLALSLALQIKAKGIKHPEKIILLSPWLDLGLSNPKINDLTQKDVILNPNALSAIAELYRGSHRLDDPMVSPQYGNLSGLGSIALFYGTHEIFYPDCVQLMAQHHLENVTILPYEYPQMQHDWLLLPIPESKQAIQDIKNFLSN